MRKLMSGVFRRQMLLFFFLFAIISIDFFLNSLSIQSFIIYTFCTVWWDSLLGIAFNNWVRQGTCQISLWVCVFPFVFFFMSIKNWQWDPLLVKFDDSCWKLVCLGKWFLHAKYEFCRKQKSFKSCLYKVYFQNKMEDFWKTPSRENIMFSRSTSRLHLQHSKTLTRRMCKSFF